MQWTTLTWVTTGRPVTRWLGCAPRRGKRAGWDRGRRGCVQAHSTATGSSRSWVASPPSKCQLTAPSSPIGLCHSEPESTGLKTEGRNCQEAESTWKQASWHIPGSQPAKGQTWDRVLLGPLLILLMLQVWAVFTTAKPLYSPLGDCGYVSFKNSNMVLVDKLYS